MFVLVVLYHCQKILRRKKEKEEREFWRLRYSIKCASFFVFWRFTPSSPHTTPLFVVVHFVVHRTDISTVINKRNPDISKMDQDDHSNDHDNEKGWTEPKTYASIAKATPQLVEGTEANTNRFEILAQEESKAKITGKEIVEMTTNDSDLSYSKDDKQEEQIVVEIDSDLSLSITSKDKEKQSSTEKAEGKETTSSNDGK